MVKKVSALEYKLHRRIISKEDFITYIQRIGYTFKREEIEFTIIHRINNVFRRATAKWKLVKLKSDGVFRKAFRGKIMILTVVILEYTVNAFWIMAAKWEMEDRTSSESARLLFLRALRFHPDNQKLYQEYFRMELMHAEKLRKEQKALEQAKMDLGQYKFSEEVMKAELARVIYKDAIQKIKGADFLLSFLSIARLFDFTKEIQDEILQDPCFIVLMRAAFSLQSLHADDPLMWDFMAKRELEVESLPSPEHESKQMKALEVGRREERCCAVYEEAVTAVPTGTGQSELLKEMTIHTKQTFTSESLPLWILRVEWTEEMQSLEDTEAFFQKGLLSLVPAISVAMKEKYLDWCYRTGGVKKAKKVFTSLQENRPFSLAFFQKMIQIEKEQETCKMQNLREYYERALREFGSEEDNLWLDYIKEELNHPQGKPENCGKIHWRAMRVLQGERVERFIAKYTLAQTGHL
ncbi:UNVERIFIED_CONTAM: hypothetical protein FKN15_061104 [Acipenser sinensis]